MSDRPRRARAAAHRCSRSRSPATSASEIGVSNWLVRFLETASIGLATSALALFWGCLALGRLVSARLGDRFDHARFAATSALAASAALVAAVARAVAAGLDRPVRCRRLRVRTGLPADHGRRRRPLPDARSAAVSGFLAGIGGHRRDRLPAGHGLRVGRGRARARRCSAPRHSPSPAGSRSGSRAAGEPCRAWRAAASPGRARRVGPARAP